MRISATITRSFTLIALLLIASPAYAQLCLGAPTFRTAPYQVGIAASFTDGARGVEGTFAGGGETLFAGAGVSVVNFTDADVRAAGVSAFAGAEVATDSRNRVLLCPVVQLGFLSGPDFGRVDVSSVTLQGGASVGVLAVESGDTMVVPFFGLAALYQRLKTEVDDVEASASDTGGVANLGVGFIVNRTVGITPSLAIPFSVGSDDPIFTIRITYNFGR
jgi:hypothetical protein